MKGIRYLPDFYIKAKPLNKYELKKCEEFCFNKDNKKIKFSVLVEPPEDVKIGKFDEIMKYVWEWPSEQYPENYRLLAPEELAEKEYYSRFVKGIWVVPGVTKEELTLAATAARQARFEFGEVPQICEKINGGD